jgi:hypothetical protein
MAIYQQQIAPLLSVSLPAHLQKSGWPGLKAWYFTAQITNKTKRPVAILKSQAKIAGRPLEFSPASGHR